MELTTENVRSIIQACLFKPEEIGPDGQPTVPFVKSEGITLTMGFHEGRLKENAEKIASLCDQLPESFREGMSFVAMCEDKTGRQWGEHRNMGELVLLGQATGKIKLLSPKALWPLLPAGMPYYLVTE
jgi:hypothetical protein